MLANGYLFLYYFWRLTHVVSEVEKLYIEYLLSKKTCLLLLLCSHFQCLFGFTLFCCLSLFYSSLLVYFLFVVWVSIFSCFYKHLFATIHLYHVHFPHCWICIVLLFIVFLLSTLIISFHYNKRCPCTPNDFTGF